MNKDSGLDISRAPFVRNVWYCAAWSEEVSDQLTSFSVGRYKFSATKGVWLRLCGISVRTSLRLSAMAGISAIGSNIPIVGFNSMVMGDVFTTRMEMA